MSETIEQAVAAGARLCDACGTPVGPLEVFPSGDGSGILCLDCYAESQGGRRVRTADEISAMWGRLS